MVRVKSEVYTKASVKAPRKQTALRGDSSKTPKNGKSNKYSGGNSYCPRSTPEWQKPITSFFPKNWSVDDATEENVSKKDVAACSSASSSEPIPCCSKDVSEHVETEEEPESKADADDVSQHVEIEEEPESKADADDKVSVSNASTMVKSCKEQETIPSGSGEHESSDSKM